MPGYSATPLVKKLGYRAGQRVLWRGAPLGYDRWLDPLPDGITRLRRATGGLDLVHVFVTRRRDLERSLADLMPRIRPDGMIWVSWPKKASGMASEVTEDTIREVALPMGLVDVKVCAVSDVWSGLKLVIRREFRG